MMDPFLNPPLDASCDGKNWFGWPCDAELAQLRLAYIAAKNDPERHRTVEAIQRRFFEAAPYAYAGQFFPQVAYRKDRLRGVIGLAAPVYWNMFTCRGSPRRSVISSHRRRPVPISVMLGWTAPLRHRTCQAVML